MTGKVRVNSAASDNVRVVSVSFYVDGRRIARDAQAPFSILWDTTKAGEGTSYTLRYRPRCCRQRYTIRTHYADGPLVLYAYLQRALVCCEMAVSAY